LKNARRRLPKNEEVSMNFEVNEKTKELQRSQGDRRLLLVLLVVRSGGR
jgi:hypothetical protein